MNKKSMKDALSTSLIREASRTADRFARAEAMLGQSSGPAEPSGNDTAVIAAQQGRGTNLSAAQTPTTRPAADRDKLIRDTFSFPASDHALFSALLDRIPALRLRTTKSELVRAGLRVLAKLSETELEEELRGLDRLKPGNPRR